MRIWRPSPARSCPSRSTRQVSQPFMVRPGRRCRLPERQEKTMSKYGSRKTIDMEWIERWARRVNEDRVMPRLGRFFDARFVLGVDDVDYLLHVRQGKVE